MDNKTQQQEANATRLINKTIDENYKNMDDLNKKAATVMKEEGMEAAVKHMFTGENGKQLSYAEMRARYG
jgi:hypothetical protein